MKENSKESVGYSLGSNSIGSILVRCVRLMGCQFRDDMDTSSAFSLEDWLPIRSESTKEEDGIISTHREMSDGAK